MRRPGDEAEPGGFLGRWARRKAAARRGAARAADEAGGEALDRGGGAGSEGDAPEDPGPRQEGIGHDRPAPPRAGAGAPSPQHERRSGGERPLPPVETLDEQSDVSPFMSPDVSEELRRLALRRIFLSARFNAVDGLDDYAENYRDFESLGDTMTAHLRHQLEREARRREVDANRAPSSPPAGGELGEAPGIAAEDAWPPSQADGSTGVASRTSGEPGGRKGSEGRSAETTGRERRGTEQEGTEERSAERAREIAARPAPGDDQVSSG